MCFVTESRKKASLLVEDLSSLSKVSKKPLERSLECPRGPACHQGPAAICSRMPAVSGRTSQPFKRFPLPPQKPPPPTTTTPFKQPLCRSEGSDVLDDPPTTASSRTSPTSSLTFCRILNNRKFPGTPIASLKALADLYSLSHSPYSPLKEPQNLSKGSFQSVYGFLPDPREAPDASPRTGKHSSETETYEGAREIRAQNSHTPLKEPPHSS